MSDPFVGEIRMFGGNFAPLGWAFCDGSLLSISENDVLFALIGTTYGGDGQTTFALPDLRSRVPIHMGNGFIPGQPGGQETVTLIVSQIPSHTHPAMADGSGVSATSPQNNVWGNWGVLGTPFTDQPANVQMNAQALQPAGSSQPHDNMLPYLAVNFIISLFGIFPPQS
jgi:microcystin-dependent protein